MAAPKLQDSLRELGFDAENYRVLMLLPLVYVAWADGKMEDVEIERIDEIARTELNLTVSALGMLDGWLATRPQEVYFRRGFEELFILAQTEDGDPFIDVEELHSLLMHAESIARATAHALDAPDAVTPEEDAALKEIAKALHIDNGSSWRQLLDEIDAGPSSIAASSTRRA